jgi:predicted enzyme related to lactoylglutathione lyase
MAAHREAVIVLNMLNPKGLAWVGLYASDLPAHVDFYQTKVGFLVEQLEAVVSALKARGVEADTEIKSHLGTRWIYYTDPEGNRFELKDLHG